MFFQERYILYVTGVYTNTFLYKARVVYIKLNPVKVAHAGGRIILRVHKECIPIGYYRYILADKK